MTYEQIAPNQYLVTLRIYRDCNGISLNYNATVKWTGSCGNGTALAARQSITDITPLCSTAPSRCAGGTGSIGIEEHIYTAMVTVPAGCNNLNFNYTLCCRNNVITTLLDPGNETIYLYARHVNTAFFNQAPIFNNDPAPIVCVNKPVIYNHGVFDLDGDSLYFLPSNCFEAVNDPVEYRPGFSGVTPLTTVSPIVINPYTGAISFTPSIQQVGVMCIVVREFRNGILIGETIRDIQFNVVACNNIPPVASGINYQPGTSPAAFTTSVCENSQVCFNLSFSDANIDLLNVTWNQEIVNGTFQVTNNNTIAPTAQFCWTPNSTNLGLNYFSVNVKDNACPIVGNSTYTYTIQVVRNTNTLNINYVNSTCTVDTSLITLSSSPNSIQSVTWTPSPSLVQTSMTTAKVLANGAANYPVYVSFANGCSVWDTARFTMPTLPNVRANANTTNLCNGGTVVLTGSGATTYTWSNGVVNGVPFTPPIGTTTYYVTGVLNNSCSNVDSIQISVNPNLNITTNPGTNLCAGQALTLVASGASTYSWNNGVSNGASFIPPVGTTTYIVTGTDVNGCVGQHSVNVTVNPLPAVEGRSDKASYCQGTSVLLTGHNAQSYTWNNGVVNNVPFIATPGTTPYTVTGTDHNGCTNQDVVLVSVLANPNVQAHRSANDICDGTSVTLTGSGAQSYVWPIDVLDGIPFIPTVGTTNYMVTGTDANGCIGQANINVTARPLPAVAANAISTNICAGQTATLTGLGAQTYVWDNSIHNGVAFVPSLGISTYTVTGTDIYGCVNNNNISIMVNPTPQISISSNAINNTVCEGESLILTATGAQRYVWNNGVLNGVSFVPQVGTTTYIVTAFNASLCVVYDTIVITVNPLPILAINASNTSVCIGTPVTLNGTGAQNYIWNNGVANGVSFIPTIGTTTYTLTATDANACSNTTSVAIQVNALPLVQGVTIGNNLCSGSTVVLTGSGAQSYLWNNGVTNGVAFTASLGTTTYTVTGTDANGCVNSANVDVVVNNLSSLSISSSTTSNVLCEGDALTLSANGAQSYVWNNGVSNGVAFVPQVGTTTYIVTGNNNNTCNNVDSIQITVNPRPTITINTSGNNLCVGENLTLNGAGAQSYVWNNGVQDGVSFVPALGTNNYTLTATDLNGCVSTESIAILVNALPQVGVNSNGNTFCAGDSVVLNGTGAQTYVWMNKNSDGVAFLPQVGNATYTVIGTDINGCQNQAVINFTVNSLPPVAVISSTNGNVLCEGTPITLSASGAQSYSWNKGVQNGISFVPPVGITTYVVSGIDANSCANYDSITFIVNALPVVIGHLSANNVCEGSSVILTSSNLTSHSWNNNVVHGVPFIPSLGTTTYVLSVTDSLGCVNQDSIVINVNPLPNVVANTTASQVCGGNKVTLFGTGAQTYVWNNGVQNGVAFTPSIGSTTYTVLGMDLNGCATEAVVVVQSFNSSIVNANSSATSLCEGDSLTLNGSGALTYSWTNGVVNGVPFVPAVGVNTYIVTGLDENLCSSTDTIEITVNALPNVMANSSSTTACQGIAIALFGSGADTYVWKSGINNGDSITPALGLNIFYVTGTDAYGCMNGDSIAIIVQSSSELQAMEDIVVCDLGFIDIVNNSSNIIAYQWGIIGKDGPKELANSVHYLGVNTNQLHVNDLSNAVNYTFYVELTGACGELLYDTLDIIANQSPIVNVLKDTTLCSSANNVIFADLVGNNMTWNDGTLGQFLTPVYSGMYSVTYEEIGTKCVVSDTLFIEMEDCIDPCGLIAPTGFSPNNDGVNDGFKTINTCTEDVSQFEMKVYDRWGSLIFQTSNVDLAWDGTNKGAPAPTGAYAYLISYSIGQERASLQGNVTIIR